MFKIKTSYGEVEATIYGTCDVPYSLPDVHEYVSGYEFRGDSDYTPSENEQTVIEDAIYGYLALLEERGLIVAYEVA